MNIEIASIWSPDLIGNFPKDLNDFDVLIQVSLQEKGKEGKETFTFRACSPLTLARTESGRFVKSTLCLEKFDWQEIQNRVEKLIAHVSSCEQWDCVVEKLSGYLDYAD